MGPQNELKKPQNLGHFGAGKKKKKYILFRRPFGAKKGEIGQNRKCWKTRGWDECVSCPVLLTEMHFWFPNSAPKVPFFWSRRFQLFFLITDPAVTQPYFFGVKKGEKGQKRAPSKMGVLGRANRGVWPQRGLFGAKWGILGGFRLV